MHAPGCCPTKGQVILGTPTRSKAINRLEQEKLKKPVPTNPGAQADWNVALAKIRDEFKKLGAKSPHAYVPPRPKLVTEVFPEMMNKRRKEDNAPSCSLA